MVFDISDVTERRDHPAGYQAGKLSQARAEEKILNLCEATLRK